MCQSTAIAGKVKQSLKCGDLVSCNTLGRHTGIVVEVITGIANNKAYMIMIDGQLIPFLSKNIKVLRKQCKLPLAYGIIDL